MINERGKYHDLRGVPIYPGDLLRTFHFRGARRKQHWLYHSVVENAEGYLEMVPTVELATGKKDGGRCWLRGCLHEHDGIVQSEVISGHGPEPFLDFDDRPKRKEKI